MGIRKVGNWRVDSWHATSTNIDAGVVTGWKQSWLSSYDRVWVEGSNLKWVVQVDAIVRVSEELLHHNAGCRLSESVPECSWVVVTHFSDGTDSTITGHSFNQLGTKDRISRRVKKALSGWYFPAGGI